MTRFHALVLFSLLVPAGLSVAANFGPRVLVHESHAMPGVIDLTFVDSNPLVVWIEEDSLFSKVVGESDAHLLAVSVTDVAVASIGERALAVWTQPSGAVMAVEIGADGRAAGFLVRIGTGRGGTSAAIAAGADRYVVTWAGPYGELYAAVLKPSGGILVPALPVSAQSGDAFTSMEIAALGRRFVVVWPSGIPGQEVRSIVLDENAVPASMTPVTLGSGSFPDIASNGREFLVVWSGGDVQGIEGRVLSPAGEVVRRVRFTPAGNRPRLAWDGSAYTIGYMLGVAPRPGFLFIILTVQRFTSTGVYQDSLNPGAGILYTGPFELADGQGRVDLAYGGIYLETAFVQPPPVRRRAARH